MGKMSKSNSTKSNMVEINLDLSKKAREAEMKYLKTRAELFKKYGSNRIQDW